MENIFNSIILENRKILNETDDYLMGYISWTQETRIHCPWLFKYTPQVSIAAWIQTQQTDSKICILFPVVSFLSNTLSEQACVLYSVHTLSSLADFFFEISCFFVFVFFNTSFLDYYSSI